MTDSSVIAIAVKTLVETGKVAAPMLIVSLAVGIGISLIQSVTQLQESTLSFVPKLVGVALVIVVAGHWMLSSLVGFTQQMYNLIPSLLGGH